MGWDHTPDIVDEVMAGGGELGWACTPPSQAQRYTPQMVEGRENGRGYMPRKGGREGDVKIGKRRFVVQSTWR